MNVSQMVGNTNDRLGRLAGSMGKRGLRSFAVAALVVLTTAASLSSPSASRAASFPYHQAGNTQCTNSTSGRIVRTFAPTQMMSVSGAIENVRWSSDLYRYNGSAWVLWNGNAPWLYGAANQSGLINMDNLSGLKWLNGANGFQNSFSYGNLPAGSYAIREYYWWSDAGVSTNEYSNLYNGITTSYCYFS
jgi:hypothetical protein